MPAEDNIWEAVAEETGWTLTDCLAHKVAFAKRADAKSKVRGGRSWGPGRRMSVCAADASATHAVAEVLLSSCIFLNTAARSPACSQVEALAQHVKRLRAAGWHLYDARERAAMDGEAMAASLAREEAARKEVSNGRRSQLPWSSLHAPPRAAACPAAAPLHFVCCPSSLLSGAALLCHPNALFAAESWCASPPQDREAHDAALREVQQQLGSLGQEVKAREAQLGERQAEVRWDEGSCCGAQRGCAVCKRSAGFCF